MAILDQIADYKREEVARAKQALPWSALEVQASDSLPVRGFKAALGSRIATGQWGLIAEIKKASPSKGLIREDFNPPALALAYEAGGAACLSVLTDTPSFQGQPEDLLAARAVTGLPALRKDFLLDPYQVDEARAHGADAVLLIVRALTPDALRSLRERAVGLGLDVLVEVHDEAEVEVALTAGADLVGVNNRDLATFATDLAVTERLAPRLAAAGVVVVGESGINTHADVRRLEAAGAHAVLVGESLMREPDVGRALARLRGRS
jgi:indole-3-glycerol phosphate synthase